MQPLFYFPGILKANDRIALPEDTTRHLVQVLRKTVGYDFLLTDGKGTRAEVRIVEAGKKTATVQVLFTEYFPEILPRFTLVVAFTKAMARNEWLLEKAAELGVARIIPLITQRSETEKFRADRWNNILISAMQQSQQYWLPELQNPVRMKDFWEKFPDGNRFIAHCISKEARQPFSRALRRGEDALLLIGPEGDFTPEEVAAALEHDFQPVTLGTTRLRTETAAMAGMAYFRLLNDH